MLFRVLLISVALLGATCFGNNAASSGAHQVMGLIQETFATGQTAPIMLMMTNNFTYNACGSHGDNDTFEAYIDNQIRRLRQITFSTDFESSELETKMDEDGVERDYLQFHTIINAIYTDDRRMEGEAIITATKKAHGAFFKMVHFQMNCRETTKMFHRMYRLFTNEEHYDYKK